MKKLPEGKLICAKNGTRYKWYQTIKGKPTYISKSNRKFASQLAYKTLLSIQNENLTQEKRALELYLRHHPKKTWNEIVTQKSPEFFNLLSEEIQLEFSNLSDESQQSVQDWINTPYEQNKNYPEHLIFRTLDGKTVRSKSENLICTFLYMHKIPYRYECALELGTTTYYPDFTIMHPVTGEIYYWEHFGMMDDRKYQEKFYSKIEDYVSNGIIPGINLIITCETKEIPLDSEQIERMIEIYFE